MTNNHLPNKDVKSNEELDNNENFEYPEEELGDFFEAITPFVFEKGILNASNEDERIEIVVSTVYRSKFETIKYLLSLPSIISEEQGRDADAEIVKKYAHMAMNMFLGERCDKYRSGVHFQYVFEGDVIQSFGYSLNEGITEWLAIKAMSFNESGDLNDQLYEDISTKSGRYYFEVKATEMLVDIVGEKCVFKAYNGPDEDWLDLHNAFDKQRGAGSFFILLTLMDQGEWKKVYKLLRGK